jgi:hypothetical protein
MLFVDSTRTCTYQPLPAAMGWCDLTANHRFASPSIVQLAKREAGT